MIQNDQENDQHSEIHTKDWFGPAMASMARLNQIQANVHNMGFHNVSSLKASRSVTHRAKPPLPTHASPHTTAAPVSHWEIDALDPQNINDIQKDNLVNYTALESTPPLSTASYQRTAWGSDHSIPDLVAQQGKKMAKLRPSSAKGQTSKLKQPSRGRPQSAKEPLCSERNEKSVGKIAVCGLKKNLSNTRPPSRGSVPSPNMTMPSGGAWAGLPPGHVIEPAHRVQDEGTTPPIAPPSSPLLGDESGEEEPIDDFLQTPPLLRRPLPQPIHLSLPSVSDSVDAIRDGCQPIQEDMDTQRLLVQADLFVGQQRIKEKEQDEAVKKLVSCNTTLPDHSDIDKMSKSKSIDNIDASGDWKDNKGLRINVSDRSQSKSNFHSRNKQKCSMFLTPDDNIERSYQQLTLVEENRSDKIRVKSAPSRYNKESINSKTGVRIREDRNVTVDITPRNVGRKVNDAGTSSPHERQNKSNSNLKKQAQISDKKMDKNLVSMINVEYQTDGAFDLNSSSEKVKGRKIKSMKEVETMVSQLSKLSPADDTENTEDDTILMSQVLHTSEGEKNYYEVSRSHSRQSVLSTSDIDNDSEKDTSVVYKTTKTMEFDETLKENSTKLAINSHFISKSKSNVNQKPPNYSSAIFPSTIKQQKISDNRHKHNVNVERDNSEKDTEAKCDTETGIDELANMLKEAKSMAVTSLYDATKRRPPSGKKVTQRPKSGISENKSKMRPSTTGSNLHSATDLNKEKKSISEKAIKSYPNYMMTKTGSSSCCRSHKSVRSNKPVVLKSVKQTIPIETPETDHCRKVQSRMAELGVDVDPRVLEKALFAPAGESLHYEVPGNLPRNPSEGLLSHYKYWLSEDYKRIQTMEKRLAQDDHIRYLQKLAAEKKTKKAAAKESKGKKKKKCKLVRSNSIV